jgi:hypothetical protein
VVVVVDLSEPGRAVGAALHWLGLLRRRLAATYALFERKGVQLPEQLRARARARWAARRPRSCAGGCWGLLAARASSILPLDCAGSLGQQPRPAPLHVAGALGASVRAAAAARARRRVGVRPAASGRAAPAAGRALTRLAPPARPPG